MAPFFLQASGTWHGGLLYNKFEYFCSWMKRFLFLLITTVLTFHGCSLVKMQNSYLSGISKAGSNKHVILLSDQEFRQTRGALNDTYYAKAGKGKYRLVFESDSGEFYLAEEPLFICEHLPVGGIFLDRNDSTFTLWTTGFFSKQKAIKKFSKEKHVKRLDRLSNGRRPFVHWYYKIEKARVYFPSTEITD